MLAEPIADWPGPGQAYTGFGEQNQRSLLGLWGDYLLAGGADGASRNGDHRPAAAAGRSA
jgi:hypothetical protein